VADWEERITSDSHPALRLEHELRYAAAAPLVAASSTWCELGCGTGIAAAAAIPHFDGRAVLVDVSPEAAAHAAEAISAAEKETVVADLATDEGVAAVRAALGDASGGAATCFEVLEHLASFTPLVELLVDLAQEREFTVAMSVPNDAFWAVENPYHATVWGEEAFGELAALLPEERVVAPQLTLEGSWIARDPDAPELALDARGGAVATHFVVAFGPQASLLATAGRIRVGDLDARRKWERQREADLAYFQALARAARSDSP
jgi:hypothetical protein